MVTTQTGQCCKTVFMLNTIEQEISTSHIIKIVKRKRDHVYALKVSDVIFIYPIIYISAKMSTMAGILTFMSRINLMSS